VWTSTNPRTPPTRQLGNKNAWTRRTLARRTTPLSNMADKKTKTSMVSNGYGGDIVYPFHGGRSERAVRRPSKNRGLSKKDC
jgi:uncharacterized protein GlcG (DUF336 family)